MNVCHHRDILFVSGSRVSLSLLRMSKRQDGKLVCTCLSCGTAVAFLQHLFRAIRVESHFIDAITSAFHRTRNGSADELPFRMIYHLEKHASTHHSLTNLTPNARLSLLCQEWKNVDQSREKKKKQLPEDPVRHKEK